MDNWLFGTTKGADSRTMPTTTSVGVVSPGCKYAVKERSDGRWNIVTSSGAVTSRATRAAAEAHIHKLIANPPKKQQAIPATRRSNRKSAAAQDAPEAGGQTARPRKGGPGRGKKRKEPDPMISVADAVLDYLEANPVVAKTTKLGSLAKDCASKARKLATEHAQLRARYDQARVLLFAELGHTPIELRRSEVAELVGTGYDDLKGRTIRRHKENVLASIRLQVGDDLFAQRQLAEAMLASLSSRKLTLSEEEEVERDLQRLVVDGIKEYFNVLSEGRGEGSKQGRQAHSDKIARESAQAAIVNKIPAGKVAAVARMLQTNRDQLRDARGKFEGYKAGTDATIYQAQPTSCNMYPEAFLEYVKKMWKAGTRKSQNKKDEVRNPKKKSDKKLYRVRFLEQSIAHLCEWMNKSGKLELDPEFHVSVKKMMELMPHQVRRPNRSTALCRYHMEFEHFTEGGRKWSASATKEAGCNCKWPVNQYEMRTALMCPKQTYNGSGYEYYPVECVEGNCNKCKDNIKVFTCEKCRAVAPFISYKEWQSVPYQCKDGRQIESYDFVKVCASPRPAQHLRVVNIVQAHDPIDEFLSKFETCCESFMPHHEHAKWQDEGSEFMRNNIHRFGTTHNPTTGRYEADPELGFCYMTVEDFSNSYTHAPRFEHMGRFFHGVTSTLYTCVLYVPLDAASDSYISHEEKQKLHQLFKENNLPPILTISLFGLSPDPHHTTAFVQHFHEAHLIPWMRENFPGARRVHFVRSDGCVGQFKCGRHFKWVSSRSESGSTPKNHSHSVTAHGKDRGDSEGGAIKMSFDRREMEHTLENPTQMDTTLELYEYTQEVDPETGRQRLQPQRTLCEKGGVGIHARVFFYITATEVNHRLAECNGVTDSSKHHEFVDIGRSGFLNIRKLSCHR